MSECRWTYYDPEEGTQTLGLYHGDHSGHVMIYLNEKVVIVDFMVHQSKSYSLVVNESLLKLNLQKENGKFMYQFEGTRIDETIHPLTKVREFFRNSFSSLF